MGTLVWPLESLHLQTIGIIKIRNDKSELDV